ncbi:DUF3592 domain-containing protein [uncultured Winogradskyella sp.]|uniref:DUF3592 domain-containing protein n=1 Tax=uncultured Winogradskyella sp. TaxID=395353 RepID=UPI00262815D4|nr:DUF3592 domain-containing protein [uncultured Winogradskyella sp.]|tara:strand:+ start:511 stop:1314 length:804 start_codon:yes stop_codon:yes gene_type:complete
MQIDSAYSLSFLAITILMVYFFVKRLGKAGCMTYGYMGLIIFCINLFTIFSLFFAYTISKEVYSVLTSGEKYNAVVISYTTETHYDSDDGSSYTMDTPTVRFTTDTGETIERELDFSTSDVTVGDEYKVNYNAETGSVITLGFTLIMKVVGAFIFSFIFTFLFIGIIMYSFGYEMEGYKNLIAKIGFNFFIPFLMIGFNALLIYGIFYGNEVPVWVTLMLGFFVFMLTLGILGYIKMMFSKGAPKMKRVSSNRWIGDWESKNKNKLR